MDSNYFEHFIIFISTVTGCVLFSVFASLTEVSVGIASSAAELKICVITAEIKNYNSITK